MLNCSVLIQAHFLKTPRLGIIWLILHQQELIAIWLDIKGPKEVSPMRTIYCPKFSSQVGLMSGIFYVLYIMFQLLFLTFCFIYVMIQIFYYNIGQAGDLSYKSSTNNIGGKPYGPILSVQELIKTIHFAACQAEFGS